MSFDHSNRRILVTGAANGLGLGIARVLASAGARLLLADVNPKVKERAAEPEFSDRAAAVVSDLAAPDAADRLIGEGARAFGSLNGLVNCGGWSFHKPALETTLEEFDRVVAINQRAPYFLSVRFAAQLKPSDEDPCVVNIVSVNALVGNPNLIAYAGTKGALAAMTRGFAVEFAPRIRFVSISPGSVRTFYTEQMMQSGETSERELLGSALIPRFITVDEIGELVSFLFSPAARSVTGANWVFDSGYTTK